MSLDTIYLDTILQHYRDPRNQGTLDPCDGKARGHNPNCGDDLMVYVRVDGEVLSEIRFDGRGCAISLSSASMMTEAVLGKRREDVAAISRSFRQLLQGGTVESGDGSETVDLGELAVMEGVRRYEARINCATLAWTALEEALNDTEKVT
jgi:nitrogen fixation NifU-like protein